NSRYAVINFSNRILRAWDRVYPILQTDEERNDANEIKAQLLAFRGFCHFELIQYFATDYQDLTAPGVIVMDFVPEVDQVFPRNTVGEVFEQIESDLNQAAELMGSSFDTASSYVSTAEETKFFINPDVITAMRASVNLFEGNYSDAYNFANSLLTGDSPYALSNDVDLASLYLDDNLAVSELIFALSRRQGDNTITRLWSANGPGVNGSPFVELSNGLLNTFAAKESSRFVVRNSDNVIE